MDVDSLGEYVSGRMKAGAVKAEVHDELLAVGWSDEEADAAYRAGVVALGMPVPSEDNRPTLVKKSSTADIVINFFSFILLGIVVSAIGSLFFDVINHAFPDALSQSMLYSNETATASSIHYSIAALLIGFPLYFLVMRMWFRAFREDEGRTESRLSKWLTYLVLLATSVTIVGDLITVIFTFLQGEITTRFFLKALTVLVIAGVVFGFYFLERRKIQYRKNVTRTIFLRFGYAVSGLIVLGIIFGFLAGGSPETARKQAFDVQRANDLVSLSSCIQSYARGMSQLPVSLDDLRNSGAYASCMGRPMQDPETKVMYEYRIVTPFRMQGVARVGEFELCATFALASSLSQPPVPTGGLNANIWYEHGSGRDCHTVTTQLGEIAPVPTPMNYPNPVLK